MVSSVQENRSKLVPAARSGKLLCTSLWLPWETSIAAVRVSLPPQPQEIQLAFSFDLEPNFTQQLSFRNSQNCAPAWSAVHMHVATNGDEAVDKEREHRKKQEELHEPCICI